MRFKVLLPTVLLAGALVGGAVWVSETSRAPVAEATPIAPLASNRSASPTPRPLPASAPLRNVDAPPPADPDAADGILADLEKPGREIHQAALQRAREMDDRAIIPRLREVAARMDDAQEKADIIDTIDFLNLPSVVEDMAAAKATGPPRASRILPEVQPIAGRVSLSRAKSDAQPRHGR